MGENDGKILKHEISDKWKDLSKMLANPYDFLNSIDDYQKPVDKFKARRLLQ